MLVALALMIVGFRWVVAVDDVDTGEMTVRIVPNGNPPASPGEEPAGSPLVSSTMGDQPQERARPGTVAASIMAEADTGRTVVPWLTIVIRDDRGTAAGWTIALAVEHGRAGWVPTLMDNRRATISFIVPRDAGGAAPESGIHSGQALGPLLEPMPILRADPGSGAGVYEQRLGVTWPATVPDGHGTLYVQMAFAP